MMHYFQAECLKCRHTAAGKVVIMMPLVVMMLAAVMTHNYFAVDSYNWWYSMAGAGMAALVCGIVGGKDRKMKNHAIWSLPCDLGSVWDAKILYGVCATGISSLVLTVSTVVVGQILKYGLKMTFFVEPSIGIQLLAWVVMWITFLWQVPLCMFLTQRIGLFPTLLLHMGIYAGMSWFVSLTPYYPLLPGAITSRMMCPVLGVLPNGLLAVEGSMTYSPELMDGSSLWIGMLSALIWFVVLWRLGRKWYERQVEQ